MKLKVDFENIVQNIEYLLNDKKINFILLNGSEKSGKTTILKQLKIKTDLDGWNTISFNISEFYNSKDYLEYFLAKLLSYFESIIGKKAVLKFLKKRNIKNIVQKNLKTNNRSTAFRFYFNQKANHLDINKSKLNNIQTLIDLNRTISISQFKWIIVFDELDNYELYNIKEFYEALSIIQKYMKNFKIIVSRDINKFESEYSASKVINSNFDIKIDLQDLLDEVTHKNKQIDLFIKKEKILNIYLINFIDNSLEEFEKWLNLYYGFNYDEKDKRYYYDEIYFLAWFLLYLKNKDKFTFNLLKENFDLYQQILNKVDVLLDLKYDKYLANLKYIEILLKQKKFNFKNNLRYLEILNLLKLPFKSKFPIFLATSLKEQYLNVINEFACLFLFNSILIQSDNLVENLDSLTFLVSIDDLGIHFKNFINCLNPRSIEQLKNSKVKESFNTNMINIIEKIFLILT